MPIADLMHAEARLLKLAHGMPGAVLPRAELAELKARYTMWKMIRGKWHDSKRPLSARSGLDLPSNQHMKGSWNAHKNGQLVDARDMLEHHYRLAR